jgi:urease accessory protein
MASIRTTVTDTMDDLSLLRLMNLVSPALPIGAFAYSQGLEYAVERGWVEDEQSLTEWVGGVLEYSLCRLDVPLLVRCHTAWQQRQWIVFRYWNSVLLASRESKELHLEDYQTGAALVKVIREWGLIDEAQDAALADAQIALAAAFAIATAGWQLPVRAAALGYLWSWTENQVAAAIKLIPLGQTAGQRILQQLTTTIVTCVEAGLARSDDDIGTGLPAFAMASARHETQYCRLFRS